ncbi:MAG: DNA repair protein RecO [Clostridia bacterium]|nr:DNA repair protein RecO [Clostridia bacterium]
MQQTEQTAIVLRYANYRDNDRMLTLLSPTRGRMEVLARGCRRPKSPLLSVSDLFALADFEVYEKSGRLTLTAAHPIETFYPLRSDYDRLTCGVYLLGCCEAVIQPGEPAQQLFMLLLHTLSRLTFSPQEWKPLLAGFLLNFAAIEGFKPRLNHCVSCGKRLTEDEPVSFDLQEGGLACKACRRPGSVPLAAEQAKWMRHALTSPASGWVNTPEQYAPFTLLKDYVQQNVGRPIKGSEMLPKE